MSNSNTEYWSFKMYDEATPFPSYRHYVVNFKIHNKQKYITINNKNYSLENIKQYFDNLYVVKIRENLSMFGTYIERPFKDFIKLLIYHPEYVYLEFKLTDNKPK